MTATRQRRPLRSAPEPPQLESHEVHPRIARRRAEVRLETGTRRRRLRWLPLAAAVTATLVVAGLFSPVVDLDHLEISGVPDEHAEPVREAAGLDAGTAMFGIQASEVRARVEALPWVAHADVDVIWPDRVAVEVTPHRPVAIIGDRTGGEAMLTSSAQVLEREDAGPLWPFTAGLPHLVLPRGSGDGHATDVALGVLSQLRSVTASLLREVRVGGDGRVSMRLELTSTGAPVEVVMGPADELPAKAVALDSLLDGTVELECLERVDVSVPTRVTLQRSSGCTVPGPQPEGSQADAPRSPGEVDD